MGQGRSEYAGFIPDGPSKFQRSCVHFVRMRHADMRLLFARFREREDILLKEVGDEERYYRLRERMIELGIPEAALTEFEAAARLQEVQSVLMFMVGGNCSLDGKWQQGKLF